MTTKDEPSSSEGRANRQDEKRKDRSQKGQGVRDENQRNPEPGTQGPDGHLDDQPQREDEYLSEVLNEFNPQRKNTEEPSTDSDKSRKGRSSRSRDTS